MVKFCDRHQIPGKKSPTNQPPRRIPKMLTTQLEVQMWVKDRAHPDLWRLHPDPDAHGFDMPPDAPMSDFWAGAAFDEEPAEEWVGR